MGDDGGYLPKRAQSSTATVDLFNKAHITQDDLPQNVYRWEIMYFCVFTPYNSYDYRHSWDLFVS